MRIAPLAAVLLVMPLLAPLPALACSKGSLWAPLDDDVVYFTGTATADTLLAGRGAVEFGSGGGHFGPGGERPIHGQLVAVEALGGAVAAGLPQGLEEVVVVPWNYDPNCRPLAWGGSARWVPAGTNAFDVAELRAPEHWVDGRPTVDLHNPRHLPYTGTELIRGMHPDTPVDSMLSPAQLFELYEVLPTRGQIQDGGASVLQPLRAWIDRHPELVGREPVEMLVNGVVRSADPVARLHAMVAGAASAARAGRATADGGLRQFAGRAANPPPASGPSAGASLHPHGPIRHARGIQLDGIARPFLSGRRAASRSGSAAGLPGVPGTVPRRLCGGAPGSDACHVRTRGGRCAARAAVVRCSVGGRRWWSRGSS